MTAEVEAEGEKWTPTAEVEDEGGSGGGCDTEVEAMGEVKTLGEEEEEDEVA